MIKGVDYYRPAHEVNHDAIIDLYGRGEPADPITVAAELVKRGELVRIGGAPYLHTLSANVPIAANAGYYAEIVRDKAILRRLVEAGTRIAALGYAGEGEIDNVVDHAQAEVYKVTDRRAAVDYAPLSDIMSGVLDEIEAIGYREAGAKNAETNSDAVLRRRLATSWRAAQKARSIARRRGQTPRRAIASAGVQMLRGLGGTLVTQQWGSMNKKIVVAAVAALAVLVGTFFGGKASSDPTASTEYKSLTKELKDTKTDLAQTEDELSTTASDLADTTSNLSDAEAQVDALMSEIPSQGAGANEPALSGGAALAPRNIKLGVRVRSKECFGSAGCLVTVQIDPSYVGNQDVTTGSWEMTYELRGVEDGPVIEIMTLEDGTFSFPEEQDVSTTSSSSPITAVVTEVYSLN
ncbi:hypothetical protein IEZ26_06650 [Nocardioides cavernae]|uniref:DNA helicase DnaB-like N-terminal domain-containing protein n=1 Tax=Nocardioides cavernae TaxID=1921566 RepID=A0ABR8N8U4_9ACTN|nr:hypothetical protein [Nocardioides cavernae]MBM7510763.1 hypothetical protein [Nocardioides cavernae]